MVTKTKAPPRRPTPQRASGAVAPCVLLTGFDAFGGDAINPSWLIAQALHGRRIAGHRIVAAQLPTVFGESVAVLKTQLKLHRPALVLCLGQAGGRAGLSVERIAINIDDARIPDNAGLQPIDQPIKPDGPAAYFSTLPIKAMTQAVLAADLPCEVSQTAGTFVCNHVFYGLMHQLQRKRHAGVRGGFVHVPYLPEQGSPSLSLQAQVKAVRLLIDAALTTARDVKQVGGAIS